MLAIARDNNFHRNRSSNAIQIPSDVSLSEANDKCRTAVIPLVQAVSIALRDQISVAQEGLLAALPVKWA